MDYTNLILSILQTFGQYGPALVKSITDLIHGNPQQANETDDAYVARLNAMIVTKAEDTTTTDNQVINS